MDRFGETENLGPFSELERGMPNGKLSTRRAGRADRRDRRRRDDFATFARFVVVFGAVPVGHRRERSSGHKSRDPVQRFHQQAPTRAVPKIPRRGPFALPKLDEAVVNEHEVGLSEYMAKTGSGFGSLAVVGGAFVRLPSRRPCQLCVGEPFHRTNTRVASSAS